MRANFYSFSFPFTTTNQKKKKTHFYNFQFKTQIEVYTYNTQSQCTTIRNTATRFINYYIKTNICINTSCARASYILPIHVLYHTNTHTHYKKKMTKYIIMEMCNREVVFKMTIMCSLKYVISLVPRLQKKKTVKKEQQEF